MTQEEFEKLFEGCHSNLDTPLMGTIYTPTCYHCKNFICPDDPFREETCLFFGDIPKKYRLGVDGVDEMCPHKAL
ncbi:MAG: hypothetical protein RSB47_05545 [Ruthenibacterium sp.]